MAKEKKNISAEEQKKKAEKRNWIKFLRGQQRTALLAVAATAAMEMGTEKAVSQQPDFNRKVDSVTQPAPQPSPDRTPTAAWPGQSNVNPDRPQIEPDTLGVPERKMPALGEKPAGINVPSSDYPAPHIAASEKDSWNYDEVKELCDDMQYDLCEDYIAECEEMGYGKEKLSYEQKLELAGSAVGVENGKVMNEDLLPALGAAAKVSEKLGAFYNKAAGQNLKDPMVQARLERDGKDMAKEAKKEARQAPDAYKKMAKLTQEVAALNKAEEHYEKTGEKTGENTLDGKIADMYKYSLKYVKEYDQREVSKSKSAGKNNLNQSAAQKKFIDSLKRGGYE